MIKGVKKINKRGLEGTVIIASIFFLLLIAVIFIIFFSIGVKTQEEVIDGLKSSDKDIILLNILRSKVDSDKDIADMLVDGYKNKNFNDAKKSLAVVMDRIYSKKVFGGFLVVRIMPEDKMVFISSSVSNPAALYSLEKGIPVVKLPIDEKKYLEVSLYD